MIRTCADEIERERELPRPLFEAMADAGLFHMAIPRSLGGAELDLPTYAQVIEEIGKADASTGWILNQGAIFGTYAARMPHEAARAIWIDTPRGVVANTPAASARAVVVPGGFRVTGRQGFSTGCRHASWVAAHAQVFDNGQARIDPATGQPEARYMFVPVGEAELLDTWKVRGMRGTGTHHFAVNDVFVPAERTVLSATAPADRGRTALQDPSHPVLRLGRRLGGARRGPDVSGYVLRARRRQDPAHDAGAAARPVDGPGRGRARRGRSPLRSRVPHAGHPRDLGRRGSRRGHAGSPRGTAPGRHALDPARRRHRRYASTTSRARRPSTRTISSSATSRTST